MQEYPLKSFQEEKMSNFSFERALRQFLPEVVVIDYKHISYPFYKVVLDLSFSRDRSLEMQEQFILECITNGVGRKQEICSLLGVEVDFTEKVLSRLLTKELIILQEEKGFLITDLGKETLKQQKVKDTVSDTLVFLIDGLTGNLLLSDNFNLKKPHKSGNELPRFVERPAQVEDMISYYDAIQKLLEIRENHSKVELLGVTSVEKAYTQWHEITLVLYKNSSDSEELLYETFSRENIADDYRKNIEKLYSRGENVLDGIIKTEMSNADEKDVIEKSLNQQNKTYRNDIRKIEKLNARVKLSQELDTSKNSEGVIKKQAEEIESLKRQIEELKNRHKIAEIIRTHEHPKYLHESFEKAKKRLMIVSPWLKGNVINTDFIANLENILKRGVTIHILYGYKDNKGRSVPEPWIVKQLSEKARKYENFIFREVENTHSKILVCDDIFGINTSFNFLSFRGDPNQTYRDESGTLHKEKELIEDLYQQGLSLKVYGDDRMR